MASQKRDGDEKKDETKRGRRQYLAPPPDARHPRVGDGYQVTLLPQPMKIAPKTEKK